MSKKGFKWTELCFAQSDSNYWKYNGRTDLSDLSNDQSINIVETYRNNGVEVTAIGVFTNLLENDNNEQKKNLAYFERLMEIASINNVPYISTECGFIQGKRGINADSDEVAFQKLVENMKWLSSKAEKYNVTIALEPCVLDVLPSVKRTVDFIDQVGSDRVKVS